ncbi:MAG: hypothetical protein JNN13_10265 [Planctomycetes bacterium]|nr:hypothetical protein [Planctomycetota bacterium]
MRAVLMLPLLCTAACWQPRYFMPRENVRGVGPDGEPAAVYQLPADAPEAVAPAATATSEVDASELRLWSLGAKARYDEHDQEVVELQIGFELENHAATPLRLDLEALRCEDLTADGALLPPLAADHWVGDGLALPGATARVEVTFRPAASVPRAIESFELRWRVLRGDGSAMSQVTPFCALWRQPAVYPGSYYGYWSYPGCYGYPSYYWGPGFGFGWGVGWHYHCR